MQIIGSRGSGNLFYVPTLFWSQLTHKWIPIRFCADTGCSFTAISDTDAIKQKINYTTLSFDKSPAKVANGGSLETRIMNNCHIAFLTDENKYHREKVAQARIMDRQNLAAAKYLPQASLLGIDVLSRFKFRFENDTMYLEK